jgi:hypothetical protein
MSENIAFYLLVLGLALLLIGYLALTIAAFRYKKPWGFAVMIPPAAPFSGLVFLLRHARRAIGPLLLLLAGALFVAAPYGLNALSPYLIDLGPHEQTVDGQLHITLTGWDRKPDEYAVVMRTRPDAVVLQMANPDVTDATLKPITNLSRLQELDLTDTQITDASLPLIAELENLHTLRLRGTKITDEGFKTHIAPMPSLRLLDLRDTAVTRETVQAWGSAQSGRRAMR